MAKIKSSGSSDKKEEYKIQQAERSLLLEIQKIEDGQNEAAKELLKTYQKLHELRESGAEDTDEYADLLDKAEDLLDAQEDGGKALKAQLSEYKKQEKILENIRQRRKENQESLRIELEDQSSITRELNKQKNTLGENTDLYTASAAAAASVAANIQGWSSALQDSILGENKEFRQSIISMGDALKESTTEMVSISTQMQSGKLEGGIKSASEKINSSVESLRDKMNEIDLEPFRSELVQVNSDISKLLSQPGAAEAVVNAQKSRDSSLQSLSNLKQQQEEDIKEIVALEQERGIAIASGNKEQAEEIKKILEERKRKHQEVGDTIIAEEQKIQQSYEQELESIAPNLAALEKRRIALDKGIQAGEQQIATTKQQIDSLEKYNDGMKDAATRVDMVGKSLDALSEHLPAGQELVNVIKGAVDGSMDLKMLEAGIVAVGAALGSWAGKYIFAEWDVETKTANDLAIKKIQLEEDVAKLRYDNAKFLQDFEYDGENYLGKLGLELLEREVNYNWDRYKQEMKIQDLKTKGSAEQGKILNEINATNREAALSYRVQSQSALFGKGIGSVSYAKDGLALAGVNADKLASTIADASLSMGQMPTAQNAADMAVFANRLGLSGNVLPDIVKSLELSQGFSAETATNVAAGLESMAEQANINPNKMYEDIAKASKEMYKYGIKNVGALGRQVAYAQSMGLSFDKISKMGDSMVLNYQDSIKAEMELSALMGEQVDLSGVRAAAAAGGPDMVQNMIAEMQATGIDVANMNKFQLQALQKAIPDMDIQEIEKMVKGGGVDVAEAGAKDVKQINEATIKQKRIEQVQQAIGSAQIQADKVYLDLKLDKEIADKQTKSEGRKKFEEESTELEAQKLRSEYGKEAKYKTDDTSGYVKGEAEKARKELMRPLTEGFGNLFGTVAGGLTAYITRKPLAGLLKSVVPQIEAPGAGAAATPGAAPAPTAAGAAPGAAPIPTVAPTSGSTAGPIPAAAPPPEPTSIQEAVAAKADEVKAKVGEKINEKVDAVKGKVEEKIDKLTGATPSTAAAPEPTAAEETVGKKGKKAKAKRKKGGEIAATETAPGQSPYKGMGRSEKAMAQPRGKGGRFVSGPKAAAPAAAVPGQSPFQGMSRSQRAAAMPRDAKGRFMATPRTLPTAGGFGAGVGAPMMPSTPSMAAAPPPAVPGTSTGKKGSRAKGKGAVDGGLLGTFGAGIGQAGKGIGTFLSSVGKGAGKAIEGILKGIGAGLKVFADPYVILGAGGLALVIAQVGAGLAAASWIMGKALPTLAEGFKSFNDVNGENLKNIGSGMLQMGAGIAAFGAGSVLAGIGGLVQGAASLLGAKSPLEQFLEFSKMDFGDPAKVKANAEAFAAFGQAMAKAGASQGIAGIGTFVSGVSEGLLSMFGMGVKLPYDQFREFAHMDFGDPVKVKANAEAFGAFAEAMAKAAGAQGAGAASGLFGGVAEGIMSFFDKKIQLPYDQFREFAHMDFGDPKKVKENAEAMGAFGEAMGKVVAGGQPSGDIVSGIFNTLTSAFKTKAKLPYEQFQEFAYMDFGDPKKVKANAEAFAAFAEAFSKASSAQGDAAVSTFAEGVLGGIGEFLGAKDPIQKFVEFSFLEIGPNAKVNAEAFVTFSEAMAKYTGTNQGMWGTITEHVGNFLRNEDPIKKFTRFAGLKIDGEKAKTNAEAFVTFSEALSKYTGTNQGMWATITEGVGRFLGNEDPIKKFAKFSRLKIEGEKAKINAEAFVLFSEALSKYTGTNQSMWGTITEAIGRFLGNEDPINKFVRFAGLKIDGVNVKNSAEAFVTFSEALSKYTGTNQDIWGTLAEGIGNFLGNEDPINKFVRFAGLKIDGVAVKANAEAFVTFSQALSMYTNTNQGMWGTITEAVGNFLGNEDPIDKFVRFAQLQIDPLKAFGNALAFSEFARALGGYEGSNQGMWGTITEAVGDFLGNEGPIEKFVEFSKIDIGDPVKVGQTAKAFAEFSKGLSQYKGTGEGLGSQIWSAVSGFFGGGGADFSDIYTQFQEFSFLKTGDKALENAQAFSLFAGAIASYKGVSGNEGGIIDGIMSFFSAGQSDKNKAEADALWLNALIDKFRQFSEAKLGDTTNLKKNAEAFTLFGNAISSFKPSETATDRILDSINNFFFHDNKPLTSEEEAAAFLEPLFAKFHMFADAGLGEKSEAVKKNAEAFITFSEALAKYPQQPAGFWDGVGDFFSGLGNVLNALSGQEAAENPITMLQRFADVHISKEQTETNAYALISLAKSLTNFSGYKDSISGASETATIAMQALNILLDPKTGISVSKSDKLKNSGDGLLNLAKAFKTFEGVNFTLAATSYKAMIEAMNTVKIEDATIERIKNFAGAFEPLVGTMRSVGQSEKANTWLGGLLQDVGIGKKQNNVVNALDIMPRMADMLTKFSVAISKLQPESMKQLATSLVSLVGPMSALFNEDVFDSKVASSAWGIALSVVTLDKVVTENLTKRLQKFTGLTGSIQTMATAVSELAGAFKALSSAAVGPTITATGKGGLGFASGATVASKVGSAPIKSASQKIDLMVDNLQKINENTKATKELTKAMVQLAAATYEGYDKQSGTTLKISGKDILLVAGRAAGAQKTQKQTTYTNFDNI